MNTFSNLIIWKAKYSQANSWWPSSLCFTTKEWIPRPSVILRHLCDIEPHKCQDHQDGDCSETICLIDLMARPSSNFSAPILSLSLSPNAPETFFDPREPAPACQGAALAPKRHERRAFSPRYPAFHASNGYPLSFTAAEIPTQLHWWDITISLLKSLI